MARTVHRTRRHLDDPLRIAGRTIPEWAVIIGTVALLWLVQRPLEGWLPWSWRLTLCAVPLSAVLVLLIHSADQRRPVFELPRRLWRWACSPRRYVPGPSRRGPLAFETVERPTREGDDDGA